MSAPRGPPSLSRTLLSSHSESEGPGASRGQKESRCTVIVPASPPPRASNGLTPRQRRYVAYLRDLIAAAPKNETFERFVRWAEETIEEILADAEEREAALSARRNRRPSRRPV